MVPGFLTPGILLGLSAGFSPGPLLTLVIAESLRHGGKAGVRAALAPLITDLPIVAVAMLLLSRISRFEPILGALSILGGLFVLYLGWENLKTKGVEAKADERSPRSLRKGILINALSPHPYLFWLTVGGPLTWRAWETGPGAAIALVGSFYFFLVGSKVAIAIGVARSRRLLTGKGYVYTMRGLGAALGVLGLLLIREGIGLIV